MRRRAAAVAVALLWLGSGAAAAADSQHSADRTRDARWRRPTGCEELRPPPVEQQNGERMRRSRHAPRECEISRARAPEMPATVEVSSDRRRDP